MAETWSGTTGDWNTASNWTPSGVPASGDTVTFANTGVTDITFSAQATPDAIDFLANAQAYTFTISSIATSLELLGAGISNSSAQTETFSASNGGTVQFSNSASAGNAVLKASSGGYLQFFNTTSAANATVQLASGGTLAVETAGNLDLGSLSGDSGSQVLFTAFSSSTPSLTVGASGASTTFAGTISENASSGAVSGALTKVGAGKLTLTGSNSYSGGTTLEAGELSIGNASALGSGTLTFAGSATLEATVTATLSNTLVVNSGASADLRSDGGQHVDGCARRGRSRFDQLRWRGRDDPAFRFGDRHRDGGPCAR